MCSGFSSVCVYEFLWPALVFFHLLLFLQMILELREFSVTSSLKGFDIQMLSCFDWTCRVI